MMQQTIRPSVASTLRWIAIAIAVTAAIDPVMIVSRAGRPLVAVVASDPLRDSAASARVIASLGSEANVVAGPFGGADATVIVGESLPANAMESATPVFAVVPSGSVRPAIELVSAPRTTTLDAVIAVSATISVGAGQSVDVALRSGDVELDRKTIRAAVSARHAAVELHAAAPDTGVQHLRLVIADAAGPVGVSSGVGDATADITVDVRPRRWNVLFFDARPSWSSRFVRMAVERDPRFSVAGRMMTSRAFASDAGSPPSQVEDDAPLRGYDAIVIGGPGALSDKAAQGLERFMRNRGGSVVLLMDDSASAGASPVVRLTGAQRWTLHAENEAPARITAVSWDGRILRASQVASPDRAPAGMTVIAEARAVVGVKPRAVTSRAVAAGASATERAIADTIPRAALWATSVGAGRLVVSGALDAWRFRDSTLSNFDRVWQDLIADVSARSPQPIAISAPDAVRPGETMMVRVTLRDVALRAIAAPSARASVSGTLVASTGARTPLRLWPAGSIGEFEAAVRAPDAPGVLHIEVTSGADRASLPFVGSASASAPSSAARSSLIPWVQGNGGKIFRSDALGGLPDAIRGATSFAPRAEPWHPMRSPWWIVPFALLLSVEWYSRRRQGLA